MRNKAKGQLSLLIGLVLLLAASITTCAQPSPSSIPTMQPSSSEEAISWQEAKIYVGEIKVVECPVVSAKWASGSKGRPTFLNLVFAHPDGTPLDPSTVTHTFIKIVRRAGLEGLRLHDLRHSYTSIMIAAGVNIKAISDSLGHANIGITLDTYGHLLPGIGREAAKSFDTFLEPWLSHGNVGKMSTAEPDSDSAPRGI